jgi:prophage regulatory protein
MTHRILRLPEVINRTGVPRSTLYAKVAEGQFPTPIKLSRRSVGWSAAEIGSWIEERTLSEDAIMTLSNLVLEEALRIAEHLPNR